MRRDVKSQKKIVVASSIINNRPFLYIPYTRVFCLPGRRICAFHVLRSSLINALALLDRDVCNVAGRSIKQDIDLLKGKAFSLWQAEVDEWYG